MPLFTRRTVLLAKIESVSGTDSTPDAANNAVQVFDLDLSIKADMKERYSGTGDRSAASEIRGKSTAEIKFTVELKGSGTKGTAPRYAPLLKSCDRAETLAANTACYYDMATSSETCTIYANIDGIYHKMVGCAGDCEIDLAAGEFPKLKFSMQGSYALPTDLTCPTPTLDSTVAQVVKGTTTTLGLYQAIIEKVNLKFGNSVVERTDMNAAEAVKGFIVCDRYPVGSLSAEMILRATVSADFWNYFDAGVTKAFSFALGSTAGNVVTITAPVCRLRAPKYGDRDGLRTVDLEFQMARNSGNDEMRIVLT